MKPLKPTRREYLEHVAAIIGPNSAAAKALAEADAHGGRVLFWVTNGMVIVERLGAPRQEDGK